MDHVLPQTEADIIAVAPTHLLSDYSLRSIAMLRPGTLAQLKACGGCSDAFVQSHGEVMMARLSWSHKRQQL